MRYAVLSDVHANLEALTAVLEDIEGRSVRKVFFLGDAVGYGADPVDALRLIEEISDEVVAGNHDHIIGTLTDMEDTSIGVVSSIRWTKGMLSNQEIEKLANLPLEYSGDGIHCVHGSPHNPRQWHYMMAADDAKKGFAASNEKIIFVGHSHIPVVFAEIEHRKFFAGEMRRVKTIKAETMPISDKYRYIINVGSVGQPRDGDPRAAYGVYDSDAQTYTLHRISYDVEKASDRIIKAGLPKELGERLKVGR
ncbi:MAG: metallophosphoesterase family protein [Desulfobacteraceae bacterium]|nr:metallophosphoesterase family protein [Desulfobacteraceae bacterium]MBC2756349.1 metallophosphoesterase family protein [Desulfobacteraceae bacterium]